MKKNKTKTEVVVNVSSVVNSELTAIKQKETKNWKNTVVVFVCFFFYFCSRFFLIQ